MKRLISVLAVAMLVLAVATATAAARPVANGTIVQTATAAGQFTTLTKLLKSAGLAGALSKPGPYTVFAPTDAAFAKVPKKTLAALGRDKAALKSVLLYHVVAGKVPASKVVGLTSAKTLNGKSVRIRTSGGNVLLNTARVTTPDVAASNGIIHVINRVLIPPAS
jgi:uncharacterized surface protein with fasciclin (FAS1) repeats